MINYPYVRANDTILGSSLLNLAGAKVLGEREVIQKKEAASFWTLSKMGGGGSNPNPKVLG